MNLVLLILATKPKSLNWILNQWSCSNSVLLSTFSIFQNSLEYAHGKLLPLFYNAKFYCFFFTVKVVSGKHLNQVYVCRRILKSYCLCDLFQTNFFNKCIFPLSCKIQITIQFRKVNTKIKAFRFVKVYLQGLNVLKF